MRRIAWGGSGRALWRYSVRRLVLIAGLTLLGWWVLAQPARNADAGVDSLTLLLLGLSLLGGLLLDGFSLALALGSINGELTAGRWELLRLTLLPVEYVIAAKQGVAEVRVWRYTILLVALRLAVAVMLLITLALMLGRASAPPPAAPARALAVLVQLLVLASLGALYVLEPIWRARMVTALGVAVSARAARGAPPLLLGVAALGVLWLAGFFLAIVVAFGVSLTLVPIGYLTEPLDQSLICSLPLIPVLFVTVYGSYSTVQLWSLRHAESWIAAWRAN